MTKEWRKKLQHASFVRTHVPHDSFPQTTNEHLPATQEIVNRSYTYITKQALQKSYIWPTCRNFHQLRLSKEMRIQTRMEEEYIWALKLIDTLLFPIPKILLIRQLVGSNLKQLTPRWKEPKECMSTELKTVGSQSYELPKVAQLPQPHSRD